MGRLSTFTPALVLLLSLISAAAPYRFVSRPSKQTVIEDATVQIECSVSGLMSALPVLWLNQSFAFGMNALMFTTSDRVTLSDDSDDETRTYILTIKEADVTDEGDYECQIPGSVRLKQKHSLTVNIPPMLSRRPDDPTDFELNEGDSIELSCPASGKPDPVITWERVDGELPDGNKSHVGETLVLDELEGQDGGKYRCTAANGFGNDVQLDFIVDVLFAPVVEVIENIVHTGPGHDVTITCKFFGNPSVQVIWLYEGQDVNYNDIEVSTKRDENRRSLYKSTLIINNITMDQMGEYTCIGSNTLGSGRSSITLSALPHSLEITSDTQGWYSDQYTLTWTVSSIPKPLECLVTVSELSTTEDGLVRFNFLSNVTVPAKISNDNSHSQDYTMKGLQENMTYTAKIKCRNEYGSTETTDEFLFKTSEDVNLAPTTPKFEVDDGGIQPSEPKTRAPMTEEVEPVKVGESKGDDQQGVTESFGVGDKDDDKAVPPDVKIGESVSGSTGGVSMATPMIGLLVTMVAAFIFC